jgi:NADPH:quinone reductase-like Zn-dependent oxidoreductase
VPTSFPLVVGLDGVGTLPDGRRIGFFLPQRPYGGMAEQVLVREGLWLPIPDGVDDVTAAAFMNPGMAAWKTLIFEGGLKAGETVLVLGATGTSGRIASQLGVRQGARVVVAGRNETVLDELVARGADAAIRVDRPHDELVAAIAAEGPYDVVIDYLWGAPTEATFTALMRSARSGGRQPEKIRYLQVGMSAGETANLPALTLRAAPVEIVGSGSGGPATLEDAAAAFATLLDQVTAGELVLDIDTVPLAEVEKTWIESGSDRRVVFVP